MKKVANKAKDEEPADLQEQGLRILARVIARCLMKAKAQSGNREDSSGRSAIEGPRHGGERHES